MPDWITEFVTHVRGLNSPEMLAKWAGISCVACILERKVWVFTNGKNLYPNLYTLLVAPPGVGKTAVIDEVRAVLATINGLHLSPSSVTRASIVDILAESTRHINRPEEVPAVVTYNALALLVNEFGVFMPSYETELIAVLADLYDNKAFGEQKRTARIKNDIKKPTLNILAGVTPGYLGSSMPEGAWDQGFASRLIMAFSGATQRRSLFEIKQYDQESFDRLAENAQRIAMLYGEMLFTEEAAAMIDKWNLAGCPPEPDHPKLHHYNTRRLAHALKLSMVAAVSDSYGRLIEKQHVEQAIDWLLEAELYMPDIFKEMSGTTHAQLIKEAWYFVLRAYNKDGKQPVLEARLVNYLQQRTAAYNVAKVIDVMEKSGLLQRRISKFGTNEYVPRLQQED